MGTEVELLLDAPPAPRRARFDAAEAEFERLEAALSRFRPTPSSPPLNRSGQVEAGPDLVRVVELALAARASAPAAASTRPSTTPSSPPATTAPSSVRPTGRRPAGNAAAAAAARRDRPRHAHDRARAGRPARPRRDRQGLRGRPRRRPAREAGPCLVNAGGDIAVRGGAGRSASRPRRSVTLELARGGLATSGRDRRHWRRGGDELHHLIDPATGRPRQRPRPRDGRRRLGSRGRGAREGAVPRRGRQATVEAARDGSPPCSSPATGGP